MGDSLLQSQIEFTLAESRENLKMKTKVSPVVRGLLSSIVIAVCFLSNSLVAKAENPRVVLETSMGEIEIELFEKDAPITVENFVKYVKKGHYDGTIFHRIIPDFVVQGGGLEENMKERETEAPIVNEASNGLKNDKMTLSMARTRDPDSATSQFYINLKYNRGLDQQYCADGYGYCVFGKVVKGEDIVEKMAKVKTITLGRNEDVPAQPIKLIKARILNGEKN
jgi:cyclophilin family peptidyl-prolyl cis-trans isomerase